MSYRTTNDKIQQLSNSTCWRVEILINQTENLPEIIMTFEEHLVLLNGIFSGLTRTRMLGGFPLKVEVESVHWEDQNSGYSFLGKLLSLINLLQFFR